MLLDFRHARHEIGVDGLDEANTVDALLYDEHEREENGRTVRENASKQRVSPEREGEGEKRRRTSLPYPNLRW